jgi:hypothetical protein
MLPKRLDIVALKNEVVSSEQDNLVFGPNLATDKTESFDISGFYAEWHEHHDGCQPGCQAYGMRVERHSEKILGLQLAEMYARQEGLALGRIPVIERSGWKVVYDSQSFLTNGAIVTSYFRKANANPVMPERMMAIVAETKRALLATAALIGLPLEDRLAAEIPEAN